MQATNMVLMLLKKNHNHIRIVHHGDWTINDLERKNAPPPGHVFKTTGTIFEPVRDIIGTHCLIKFHEDGTINVASRVLKRKNAPSPDIIETNVLTKCHEDRTINVASRVLTRQMLTPHNTLRMPDKG
ncbi:hypothetical protein DPMN_058824 [Dreissena polymorpha]|uniref:Uncharacterized protein n=1 Tax=Dreissena polymorpha TaxID=45954 RepID=A0A9D4C2T9_DREPO|nr:hypothetical protein DPMN_058824 [Dreissena polymorpha]